MEQLPFLKRMWTQIGFWVLLALLMNGAIYYFGWNATNAPSEGIMPSGYVIAIIWLVLFGFMGAARWVMQEKPGDEAKVLRWALTGILVLCLLWPLYTLALKNPIAGLIGSAITFLLSLATTWRLWLRTKSAAFLMMLPTLWLACATLLMAFQLT
jgi:tryptophan-rich sensory protein